MAVRVSNTVFRLVNRFPCCQCCLHLRILRTITVYYYMYAQHFILDCIVGVTCPCCGLVQVFNKTTTFVQ